MRVFFKEGLPIVLKSAGRKFDLVFNINVVPMGISAISKARER